MEQLNWNKQDRFAIQDTLSDIEKLTKEIVKNDLNEISNKIQMLQTMGVVIPDEKLNEIKNKIKDLNI